MGDTKQFLKDAKANESFQVYTVFHLLAYTGCRQGEILGLKWDCIDFDSKTLNVRQTLTRGENRQLYLEEPKTKKSKRIIPLDDSTISILKTWRTTQRKNMLQVGINTMDAKQLVFSDHDNNFIQIRLLTHGYGCTESLKELTYLFLALMLYATHLQRCLSVKA
ncbi:MAG: site-specific integrase [Enterococcus avium]|nr:site-specific integrase [Enterococcus avium]MDU3946112.1 site-specific integrase [Enterococcus avium]